MDNLSSYLPYIISSLALLLTLIMWPSKRRSDFTGKVSSLLSAADPKHCYITGGSSGLGRALAEELVRKGADVTIVARDPRKLAETELALKVCTTCIFRR
jgi:hypothetical protein